MYNPQFQFAQEKYVHLKNFLDVNNCNELTTELKKLVDNKATTKDAQCPSSEAIHGAMVFDKLLIDLLPYFEEASGKKLYPTYSYARLYKTGEKLKVHRDRESCEISATLTLGFEGTPWPIYMSDTEDNGNKIVMNIGDVVLYRGMEKYHWRKKFKGEWQAQVFLHYVDADGPYKEWKFDKRTNLNLATLKEKDELLIWHYNDIFVPEICDQIVKTFSDKAIPKEPAVIGSGIGTIDTSIRNVERVFLPTYKDLGGQLVAAGLAANAQSWKFDITHSNQAEFLIYPAGGRYKAHVDTFLNHSDDCRKLTVLVFLNDDFKGGKFYLQNGHNKYYPPQSKGTVIVFPSFIMHGVEDVEEGTRYSAVCWMLGKFFK